MADIVLRRFPLGFAVADVRPVPLLRPPPRRVPRGQRPSRPGGVARRARDRQRTSPGIDGWRMYHGATVPGFPQHPHRGFETVTFVRRGLHRPLRLARRGGALRPGRRPVAHRRCAASSTPRCSRCSTSDEPNPRELFQIWLNLPARRQDGRAVLHDAVGRRRSRVVTTPRRRRTGDDGDDHRRHLRRRDAAAASPELVGVAPRRRRRHLARRARAGRDVDAPADALPARPVARSTSSSGDGVARRRHESIDAATRRGVRGRRTGRRRQRRRTAVRGADAAGSPDRRAGRPVRTVRDERSGRDRAGLRRLPPHRLRRLAVADRRPRARPRPPAASPAVPTGRSRPRRNTNGCKACSTASSAQPATSVNSDRRHSPAATSLSESWSADSRPRRRCPPPGCEQHGSRTTCGP